MYRPMILRLFSFILEDLQDPVKSGGEIYDLLKDGLKGRIGDQRIFVEPVQRGILYLLGHYAFDQFVLARHTEENDYGCPEGYEPRTSEHFLWYMADFLDFIDEHEIEADETIRTEIEDIIDKADELYGENEEAYFDYLESIYEKMKLLMDKLKESCYPELEKLRDAYSMATARRIFHDRELCEWISDLVVFIGFPGEYEPWLERVSWPAWVKPELYTREGGCCAACGFDFTRDPEVEQHIDHIIPISIGGCNDLVNLQLLCRACNLKKQNRKEPVQSSIPNYLSKKIRQKKKR